MAQVRKDFQGRGEVQTFSRARIQAMGDGVQLALRVPRQVRALRQVLAQQPVGVLLGAALPRAVRIGKEHSDVEPLRQARVLGHLFPAIVGQGFAQRCGHVPELLSASLSGTRRIRPLHPGQEDQAGRPLHQGADGRPITGSLDEIAFPVAGHRASPHFGRAFGNRRHMGDLAPSLHPPAPEASAPCAPDGVRPAVRSAGFHGVAHTGPHRWSRSRAVSACRQDTRVGDVRQSVQASRPQPDASSHIATARGRGVYAVAVADGLG
mgnify:CR=1 FL=1